MAATPVAPTPTLVKRLVSMLYESLLVFGVVFLGFLAPHIALGILAQTLLPGSLLLLHLVVVVAAYFLWYWRRSGQTLAMQTWKIRLESATGGAPRWGQLVLRFLLIWPSVFCLGIGIIWAVFDRDRQFLHDRLAGTRLVRV